MHRYLVVSDTHGRDDNFYNVLDAEAPLDGIIHCGDFEGSEGKFALAADCPVYFVAGNNDFFSSLGRELTFTLDGHKAFLTHGHQYLVSLDLENLRSEGISRGAELIFYGHTHKPVAKTMGEPCAVQGASGRRDPAAELRNGAGDDRRPGQK